MMRFRDRNKQVLVLFSKELDYGLLYEFGLATVKFSR